jgi:hypothetical protein
MVRFVCAWARWVYFFHTRLLWHDLIHASDTVAKFAEWLVSTGIVVAWAGFGAAFEWVDWGLRTGSETGAFNNFRRDLILRWARVHWSGVRKSFSLAH